MGSDPEGLSEQGKLLFGAGFVFGAMVTMVILAVVLVVVTQAPPAEVLATRVVVGVVSGALFSGIIGVGLYVLAFPENRMRIPIDSEQFERDRDGTDGDSTAGPSGDNTAADTPGTDRTAADNAGPDGSGTADAE